MSTWSELLALEHNKDYFQRIITTIANKRAQGINIYPADDEIFTALSLTPFEQIKVVILGQDPYHGEDQAHGLSFSVKKGVKIPPSLRNIYKELSSDIEKFETPEYGYLQSWAEQGILLLNTVLSVEQGQAHSHKDLGWEQYTDKIIEFVNNEHQNIIFLLWGAHAQKKGKAIDRSKHSVLIAPHPSPLSAHRGFLGCQHFSKTNELLRAHGKQPINWQIYK
ncbi:MAG: uracil-DNA glycosylase [Gammaproteobacteria bacterium]|nr:MAG: uracil-DNA glycosylase [Gammaproteobacteria bacterium]